MVVMQRVVMKDIITHLINLLLLLQAMVAEQLVAIPLGMVGNNSLSLKFLFFHGKINIMPMILSQSRACAVQSDASVWAWFN